MLYQFYSAFLSIVRLRQAQPDIYFSLPPSSLFPRRRVLFIVTLSPAKGEAMFYIFLHCHPELRTAKGTTETQGHSLHGAPVSLWFKIQFTAFCLSNDFVMAKAPRHSSLRRRRPPSLRGLLRKLRITEFIRKPKQSVTATRLLRRSAPRNDEDAKRPNCFKKTSLFHIGLSIPDYYY
jgi:hypothetical protein